MPVSPEWFCGVFSEVKSVNLVIVDKLGSLKHAKKIEAEGPLQQMKSVKAEILLMLGKKSLSKTVISLAVPSSSFQMFIDSESVDLEYLNWKSSMYAGNMTSRMTSVETSVPFTTASMRSEEVLPWKEAIKAESLWVCSIETQQSAFYNALDSISDLNGQNVNLMFSNDESFVIYKKDAKWSGWSHVDLGDMTTVSKISSENETTCLYIGEEHSSLSSVSGVKALDSFYELDSQKEELRGCFGVTWDLANKYKGSL